VNHLEEADHRRNRRKAEQREGVDHRSSQGGTVSRDRVTRRDHQAVGKTRVQARVAGLVVNKRCCRGGPCEGRFRGSYSAAMWCAASCRLFLFADSGKPKKCSLSAVGPIANLVNFF
jgi:hypothetical protein